MDEWTDGQMDKQINRVILIDDRLDRLTDRLIDISRDIEIDI